MCSAVIFTTVSADPVDEAGDSGLKSGTGSYGEPKSDGEDDDRGVLSRMTG
jgi:hypothetical protein